MLPDSVRTSKPVFRLLAARTEDELEILEKIKQKQEKKRKSRTQEAKGQKSKVSGKQARDKALSELEPDIIDEEDQVIQDDDLTQNEIDVINQMLGE